MVVLGLMGSAIVKFEFSSAPMSNIGVKVTGAPQPPPEVRGIFTVTVSGLGEPAG